MPAAICKENIGVLNSQLLSGVYCATLATASSSGQVRRSSKIKKMSFPNGRGSRVAGFKSRVAGFK